MIYAVNKFFDQIKARTERHDANYQDQYEYFDTEREARDFIRKRSLAAYYAAEDALEKARKRHNRNCKKYPPIRIPEPDEQFAAPQRTQEEK